MGSWGTDLVDWVTDFVTTFSEVADNVLLEDWVVGGETLEVGERATDTVSVGPVEDGECAISILSAGGVGIVLDDAEWGGGVTQMPVVESLIPVSIGVILAGGEDNDEFLDKVGLVLVSHVVGGVVN